MRLGDLLHFELYVQIYNLDHNILMLSKSFFKGLCLGRKKYFLKIKSTKGITKGKWIEKHHAKKLKGKLENRSVTNKVKVIIINIYKCIYTHFHNH